MGFQSIDELQQFSFEDCQIDSISIQADGIYLEVEALIVLPNNSQNTNYTASYADVTQIRLQGGKLLKGWLAGYKYYDANDNLLDEVPDKLLEASEIEQICKQISGAYLYSLDCIDKSADGHNIYAMGIEFADEEEYSTDSVNYRFEITFDKAIVNWERYLNRVQR